MGPQRPTDLQVPFCYNHRNMAPNTKRPITRAERRARETSASRKVERRATLDMLAEYAIYGIAGLIPLAVISTPEFLLYETPKVALLNILTMVTLLAWLNRIFQTGVVRVKRPPFLLPVLTYFGIYTVATVLSVSPILSIFGIVDRSMGLLNLANLVILYFLVFNVLTAEPQQKRCLKALVWGSTLVALLGVLQFFGVNPLDFLPYLKGERVGSTLGNADYCTPVIVLALPLAVAFVVKKRFWYLAPVVLLFLMLLFSLPIHGLTGNWVIQVPQGGEPEGQTGLRGAATTVATVAVERVQIRKGLWEAGVGAVMAHPVLGTGPNTYRDVFTEYEPLYYVRELPDFREDKAHNEYIEVAQSTGLAGLAAYLWMMGAAVLYLAWWVWKNRTGPNMMFVAAIVVGVVGYLAYTFLLFHTIAAYAVFWILLGVGAAMSRTNASRAETRKINSLRAMAPYIGFLSVIILVWVGLTAMRPVWGDLAEARANGIAVRDERSGTLAADWYRKAADWHPFEYSYLRNAAHALSNRGASLKKTPVTDPKFQEAFYYIDRAQKQEPQNATVYYNRALVYRRSGKSDEEVLQDLNTAVEHYPYYILAWNMIGDVERSRGDFEKAIAARMKALEITPNDAAIMVEIGYDDLQAGKFAEAIEMLEKGIAAGSDSARARFLLGGSYELSGNKEKAKQAYEAALKLDPSDARAREGLGRVGS